ncbi:MAG: LexA family transcriptional regulator [Ottowia sp.]|nr:LexA family transcriptional regulator [Ottowia sp.]
MTTTKLLTQHQIEDARRLRELFNAARAHDRSLTQEKLAFICGWKTQGAVSQYFLGKIPLNLEALLRFSKALHTSPDAISPTLAELLPYQDVGYTEKEKDAPAETDLMQIRESTVDFGAGLNPEIIYQVVHDSTPVAYRLTWLREHNITPQNAKRLRVNGESMEPFLFNSDTVLVNLNETEVNDGKVYAFRYKNELRIKRLFKKLDGTLLLRSDNPRFIDEEISPDQAKQHITIIGRVRGKFGSGGL